MDHRLCGGEASRRKKTPPQSALGEGLVRLEGLVKRYGQQALRGDPEFFITLQNQRGSWGEEFALDVLERQLRPKADEAFRQRNYCEASRCMSALLRALLRQSRRSWRLRRAAVRDSAQRKLEARSWWRETPTRAACHSVEHCGLLPPFSRRGNFSANGNRCIEGRAITAVSTPKNWKSGSTIRSARNRG